MTKPDTEFSPLIERWMPDASMDEKRAAQDCHEQFVTILYRICDRLAREKEEAAERDKSGSFDTMFE